MTLKYVLPVIAMAASAAAAAAEEYQVFTGLQLTHLRFDYVDLQDDILVNRTISDNGWQLDGRYFFDKKTTLGPLDQFEYINKVTNVSASFNRVFDNNAWTIGGEYFAENGLVVSAGYSRFGDENINQLGLGYLVSNNFIVRAEAIRADGSNDYRFSASYNHQLQGSDYVGFTAYTDDSLDYFGISGKYFASLNGDRFITAGITIEDNDGSSAWAMAADYYFSKMTSVGLTYSKADDYSLNAKHFFTQNWAVEASFASNTDNDSMKAYSLGITGQF
ncbi:putative porin [Rheinheimera maricola]|uniref:Porin n=1 Tax=Rheinheimera maricola TaxID=2793282 RepID=A0ABS7XC92_9GAMM|nr:putative porin [Rheinheimera maricola]MBZ9613178.1 putative porin [Rheinheimera maricola]